jgi:NAD(P)H dehydrogenase (quinone)
MADVNVLIAFYSRTGVTEALARAIAEGAERQGAAVRLRRAREFVSPEIMANAAGWAEAADAMNARHPAPSAADAEWADAIVFGTPTRFGSVASELKAYIDSLGGLWVQGKLNGKAGAVFCSTSTPHGGNESTLLSMYNPLAHLGFIIVPTAMRMLPYTKPGHLMARVPSPTIRQRRPAPMTSKSHVFRAAGWWKSPRR